MNFNKVEKTKKYSSKAIYTPPCLIILYDIEKITHGGDPHIPQESQGTFS